MEISPRSAPIYGPSKKPPGIRSCASLPPNLHCEKEEEVLPNSFSEKNEDFGKTGLKRSAEEFSMSPFGASFRRRHNKLIKKSRLILGALSVLPPMLCWYFPSLMPMVPLALLLMFLSWLAVARKPAYFTSEFYPASEKTTAFGRA